MKYTHKNSFPNSYQESRQSLLIKSQELASQDIEVSTASYPISEDKNLNNLWIDFVYLGNPTASDVLCISSGTHGVEGFLGAALQHHIVNHIHSYLKDENMAILLIHAVNPYGFKYLRRTNENNIDLNRNFVLPHESHQGAHPNYQEISHILKPSLKHISAWHLYRQACKYFIQYGLKTMTQIIAQGQYIDDQSLFFGGKSLSQSAQVIRTYLPQWFTHSKKVVHLDIHTGFGKYAGCILASADGYPSEQLSKFAPFFLPQNIDNLNPSRDLYTIQGEFIKFCAHHIQNECQNVQYLPLIVEYGTYHSVKVLQTLRKENTLYHQLDKDHPQLLKAKQALKECFIPQHTKWRTQVMSHLTQLAQNSIQALLHGFDS